MTIYFSPQRSLNCKSFVVNAHLMNIDNPKPDLIGTAKRYAVSSYAGMGLLSSAAYRSGFFRLLRRPFPSKPTVLQFPVNDTCNSHCVMCNIWKRKQDKEFTVAELQRLLKDPLFDKIRYVGINGGEPTLRPDLAEIGQTIVDSFPHLKGVGILTNALNPKQVMPQIVKLSGVMSKAAIPFSVAVSLDGIGDDHDKNRGTPGGFKSAIEVISALKAHNIPVSIGCTLTPLNCYCADDVLLWCEQAGIPYEFRLGVEIKRVYNEGFADKYPLSQEQRFHLAMFFEKLSNNTNAPLLQQHFYKSLGEQLFLGKPRQVGCDWQSEGVTLDARGNISYCSVQSPILGSSLENSAWSIYKTNLSIRQRIVDEKCQFCKHDLLGPLPPKVAIEEGLSMMVAPWLRIGKKIQNKYLPQSFSAPKAISEATRPRPSQWRHVLITGWYGTETSGDKAILGEVLHFLDTYAPGCRVSMTTLNHKVSVQTNLELARDIALVDMCEGSAPAMIESVDAVIIGGGPLEEIDDTEHIWRMFVEANRQKKARVIFGCGIGPIYTERIRSMVGAICQMATTGFLRDEESREYAFKLGATASFGCACDPAIAYFSRWRKHRSPSNAQFPQGVVGLLRANTNEYVRDLTDAQLAACNETVAKKLAQILEDACRLNGAYVDLLPMHSIWVGGDDRIFNRQIAKHFNNPNAVRTERRYLKLDDLICSISSANAAVAMRYHGHLACLALGIPFLSINYTGEKSKVASLIKRIGYDQWSETWRDMDPNRASVRLQRLMDERSYWSTFLSEKSNSLVTGLMQTYSQVFHIKEVSDEK